MSITNTKIDLTDDLKFLITCCKTELNNEDIEFLALNADTPVSKEQEGCIRSYLNPPASSSQSDTETSFLISHFSFLISMATRHGVLPLVYKTIKNLDENYQLDSSAEILTELKALYMGISQRNMMMSAELLKIMLLLEKNGIEALAFKGPALSQMAYGDITLRQYVDLDILVDEDDAFKAAELMTENGHVAILPLTILSNKTCLHTAKDFSLMSDTGGVHTELHWRLFEKKYNISLLSCAVEKKCQTVKINNHEIKTLQTELLLVYLCLHGAKHAFERIEWICDIDRLIRSSEIHWEDAIAIAERSHSKRAFYLGLSLAHHLLHTALPAELVKDIDEADIRTLHTLTLKQMSGKNNEKSDFKKNRDTFFYQSRLFDQKSDMIRFYLSTFFKISTTDCQTFILPEKLKFLYILLRPLRLLWSYGKKILGT